jgi:hypothetical protein
MVSYLIRTFCTCPEFLYLLRTSPPTYSELFRTLSELFRTLSELFRTLSELHALPHVWCKKHKHIQKRKD